MVSYFSKVLIVFSFGVVCSHANAEMNYPIQSPKDRFTKYINVIKPRISEASKIARAEDQLTFINQSGVRSSLNYLQSLIGLYDGKKRYSKLKPFFKSVKALEDHISHYEDLKGFVVTARNGKVAKKYEDLFAEETASYIKFLKESNWMKEGNLELVNFEKALNQIEWESLEMDRNFLLTAVAHKMKKQQDEVYDMSDYELGMHEFRRDARRISYLSTGIGELIQSSNDQNCPMNLPIDKAVAKPKNQNSYICYLPNCLQNYLSKAQSDISNYKYQGQDYTLRGEVIPENIIKAASEVAQKVKESNIYLYVENQILGCRTEEYKNFKKDKKDEQN